MKAKDILEQKGRGVITCSMDNTLLEALRIFAKNKVGSLLVVDEKEKIQGILCPRDILLAVLKDPENVRTMLAEEVMTRDVLVVTLDDSLSHIQSVMTENRVRHVPILNEKGELVGVVSIGDLLKAQGKQKEVENRYLKDYIEGKYPG